jgi:uncharacterized protein (DUF58 family)
MARTLLRSLRPRPERRSADPDPLAALDLGRLERLSALAADLVAGRPLHPGGTLPGRDTSSGLHFLEHRRFSPGDDPRGIDWRATARRRDTMVRRYRDEHATDWLIALDRSASMGIGGVWPPAVQLAAAAGFVLTRHGHQVLLALFSDALDATAGPGRCAATRAAMIRLLRATKPAPAADRRARTIGGSRPEACLPLAERRRVLLISDCLRPDAMANALARLAGASAGLELLRIAAPAPEETGPALLLDVETGDRRSLDCDTDTVRSAAANLAGLLASVDRHCGRLGVPVTVAIPGRSWETTLVHHLLRHGSARHRTATDLARS